jgi:hypothetical protein
MREISRADLFFRLCKRRILPIMSMVLPPVQIRRYSLARWRF